MIDEGKYQFICFVIILIDASIYNLIVVYSRVKIQFSYTPLYTLGLAPSCVHFVQTLHDQEQDPPCAPEIAGAKSAFFHAPESSEASTAAIF